MRLRHLWFTLAWTALVALAAPAAWTADDGADDRKAKIKRKLEEILRLMQENENALIKASTGEKARPKPVDVDPPLPPAPPAPPPEGSPSEGSKEDPGRSGREISKKLTELLEMIPSRSGGGGGSGSRQQSKSGAKPKDSNELREGRSPKDKQSAPAKGSGDPEAGTKSPRDPADRVSKGGSPDDSRAEQPKREDDVQSWWLSLPAEIREAWAGGRFADIPPELLEKIRRYHKRLNEMSRSGGGR